MTHFGSGEDFRLSHLMITLHAKDGGWWPNLLSWWGHKMMSAWSGGTERIRRSITGLIPAVRRIRSYRLRYQLFTSTDLIHPTLSARHLAAVFLILSLPLVNSCSCFCVTSHLPITACSSQIHQLLHREILLLTTLNRESSSAATNIFFTSSTCLVYFWVK